MDNEQALRIYKSQLCLVVGSQKAITYDKNDKWSYFDILKLETHSFLGFAIYASIKENVWNPIKRKVEEFKDSRLYTEMLTISGPFYETVIRTECPPSHFWQIVIFTKKNKSFASYCVMFENKRGGSVENLKLEHLFEKVGTGRSRKL